MADYRLGYVVWLLVCAACGGSTSNGSAAPAASGAGGTGADGGSAGAGLSAGQGGAAATAGMAGSAGLSGGAAGTGGGASGSAGSSGTAGSAGAAGPLAPAITSYCHAAQTCCAQANITPMLSDCEGMFASRQPAAASVDSGAVTVDSAALAACVAAYEQASTQCNYNAVTAACRGVFVGTKNVDEPCSTPFDCKRDQGPMTCLVTDQSMPPVGVCKPVPHAQQGQPCASTCRIGDDCSSTTLGGPSDTASPLCFESESLYCDYSGSDPVCSKLVLPGVACSSDDQCGSEGYCQTTCQARSGLGQPCGNGCRHELQCGDNGTCRDPAWATDYACMGYAPAP